MKLTKEQVMVAKAMKQQGTSIRQLARQLGVAEGTVRYRFREAEEGPSVDGRSRQPTAVDSLLPIDEVSTESGKLHSRMRRIGIVALARKLMIALWRYLETGVLPEGAVTP